MVEVYSPERIKEDYVRDCFQYIFDQMCIEGMDIDYFLELTGINIVSPDEECYERNKIYSFIRYLWLFEEHQEAMRVLMIMKLITIMMNTRFLL